MAFREVVTMEMEITNEKWNEIETKITKTHSEMGMPS